MDGIATATEAIDEGRQHSPTPEAGRVGPGVADADRFRAGAPPLARDGAAASEPDVDPPSPDAVVAVSLQHDAGPEERAREREAALRARHAAEVAPLRVALRAMEEAHAAEVARLRAEHAADTAGLRRAAEASLRAELGTPRWRSRRRCRAGPPTPTARRPVGDDPRAAGAAHRNARRRPAGALPWPRLPAKPFAGAHLIAAVRALRPAGAAALSRFRGAVLPPQ